MDHGKSRTQELRLLGANRIDEADRGINSIGTTSPGKHSAATVTRVRRKRESNLNLAVRIEPDLGGGPIPERSVTPSRLPQNVGVLLAIG